MMRYVRDAPGATMADALTALDLPAAESYVTLVNVEIVRATERAGRRLAQGDALIVFPPIKGGYNRILGESSVCADVADEGIDTHAPGCLTILDLIEAWLDNQPGHQGRVHGFLNLCDRELDLFRDLGVAQSNVARCRFGFFGKWNRLRRHVEGPHSA